MPDKLLSALAPATLPLATTAKLLVDTGAAELQSAPLSAIRATGLPNIQQFTASGTWTKPAGCSFVKVVLIAGGQGGGSGRQGATGTARGGGIGGTPGESHVLTYAAASLGSTEAVAFTTGGAGGAAVTTPDTNGNNGQAGANITFAGFATGLVTVPIAGNGGTAATQSFGATFKRNLLNGVIVAHSVTAGTCSITSGTGNAAINTLLLPGPGAGGSSITTANAILPAGGLPTILLASGLPAIPGLNAAVGAAAAEGQAGTIGQALGGQYFATGELSQITPAATLGVGGAGGGGGLTMAAGTGGNGGPAGSYGGGGGGGGASTNGFASGKGGDGGPAIAIIIAY